MNSFRKAVKSGRVRVSDSPLISEKHPSGSHALGSVEVVRDAVRTADHRDDDRHRLAGETASVVYRNAGYEVELINLSGGGAMVRSDFTPKLWDSVELVLGDQASVECAVRWIRGDRIGLEFAHETRVQGDARARDAMLLEVIRRSFPDLVDLPVGQVSDFSSGAKSDRSDVDVARRSDIRHPLIWSGSVHYCHDSFPVRLRNVSPNGALVESQVPFPIAAELFLDLEEAGSLFATVSWALGDQVGLKFAEPFDISQLAKSRPDLAPHRWSTPTYLRDDQGENSPWAKQWNRLSVDELKTTLESYLKH